MLLVNSLWYVLAAVWHSACSSCCSVEKSHVLLETTMIRSHTCRLFDCIQELLHCTVTHVSDCPPQRLCLATSCKCGCLYAMDKLQAM